MIIRYNIFLVVFCLGIAFLFARMAKRHRGFLGKMLLHMVSGLNAVFAILFVAMCFVSPV